MELDWKRYGERPPDLIPAAAVYRFAEGKGRDALGLRTMATGFVSLAAAPAG